MTRTRPRMSVRHIATLLGLSLCLGCTLILQPDDTVERCEKTQDCSGLDDNRYQQVCQLSDDQEIDGVCVAQDKDIKCAGFDVTHPVTMCTDQNKPSTYTSCPDEQLGQQGCPGACESGLSKNEYDVCDVSDPDPHPAVEADPNDEELLHQDIYDQFCRQFFCAEEYVCDRSGNNPTCKPCDPNKPYGGGGCGNLYRNGELSPVYKTDNEIQNDCQAPKSASDNAGTKTCDPPDV